MTPREGRSNKIFEDGSLLQNPSINHTIASIAHHENAAAWFFEGSIINKWMSSPSDL
jgi:hypothetical protein